MAGNSRDSAGVLAKAALRLVVTAGTLSIAGCAGVPPSHVDAGRLGRVAIDPPIVGSYEEGTSKEWAEFVVKAAFNRYYKENGVPEDQMLPKAQIRKSLARLLKSKNGVLWIGHSTFLIRSGGRTILTDPVFTNRTSPVLHMGPRRYFPPAVEIADLPPIDAILISHNHYDHMSTFSLDELGSRFRGAALILPAGNELYGAQAGFRDVRGILPGETTRLGNVTLTAMPAYHRTSRIGVDAAETLALSWSIRPAHGPGIFFAGDTAYGPVFKRIRKTYGAHQVALVPIGAYFPHRDTIHIHVNPEEAAWLARDLGARLAIAMHWGTFPLSDEPYMEPATRFLSAGGPPKRVMRFGESLIFRNHRNRLARR